MKKNKNSENLKKSKMKTTDKILLTLGAAATGVAIGLLFAPKSGKALRKDIADEYDRVKEKSEELLKEGQEFAQKTLSSVKNHADKQKSKA